MSRIYVSIVLPATAAQVWEVVEPVEHHVEWMHDAVAIRFVGEQRRGEGTSFLCDTKVGPIKLTDRMTITEWVPEQAMGVRHTGVVTGVGRFTMSPAVGGGTLFAWEEDLTFPWFLGGPIGAYIGGQLVMKAIWRRNLRELAAVVAGHVAAAPEAG